MKSAPVTVMRVVADGVLASVCRGGGPVFPYHRALANLLTQSGSVTQPDTQAG